MVNISDAAWAALSTSIGLLALVVKSVLQDKDKGQLETAKESADINQLLSRYKHETFTTTCFVLGYHNGGKLYNHQSRQKCTMLYGRGLKKPMQEYRDVPISYFGSMLLALHEQGKVFHTLHTMDTDSYFVNDSRYREVMIQEFETNSHIAFSFYGNVWKWRLNILPLKREKVVTFSVHFMRADNTPYSQHDLAEIDVCISKIKSMLQ